MTLPNDFKRPMLAVNYDDVSEQPAFRVCSEKLDGIRILFFGGVAYSRSLKPLPNLLLQKLAKENAEILEGCDGEVIAGDLHALDVLQRSNSFCMKSSKIDDYRVYLFDRFHPTLPWWQRYQQLEADGQADRLPLEVKVLEHYALNTVCPINQILAELDLHYVNLDEFEAKVLAEGAEGVMVRDYYGKYKQNRSGKIKPELQKVKRMQDDDFKIVGYTQYESNLNEATIDERGFTKRSTSKEGKQLVEALGGLVLLLPDGRTFNCGSGFTADQRKELWFTKEQLIGKLGKIQFFGYSYDGIPLLPVFLDFRSELDL